MNALGLALVWCVVQVSILASVAAVLYIMLRRHGPPARALAAFAGLVLIVALSALTFSPWPHWQARADPGRKSHAVSEWNAARSARGETASEEATASDQTAAQETGMSAAKPSDTKPTISPAAVFFETLFSEMQRPRANAASRDWGWPAMVAVLFLIVAGIGVIRLVAGLAMVRSYRMRARPIADASLREMADALLAEFNAPRTIALCESELLATPATIGWRHPLIILPANWRDWSVAECRAVLAHEIAHVARHDFATWVAAQLAVVLHFYHPLVHWLAARLRLEQELAADAAAARLAGGQRLYLTTLAGMALRQSDRPLAWPARTFLPTRGTFMRRIEMLRDETSMSVRMSPVGRIAMIVILLAAGLAVAGLRGTAGDREVAAGQSTSPAIAVKQAPRATRTGLDESGNSSSSETSTTSGTSISSSGSFGSDGRESSSTKAVEPFSLAYVPRDAVAVVAVRPAELLNRPALAPLKKLVGQERELQQSFGIAPERVEQLTVVFVMDLPAYEVGPGAPALAGMIMRLAEAKDADGLIKALQPNPEEQEYGGRTYIRGKTGTGSFCLLADERTVVTCDREDYIRRLIVAGKTGASKAKWSDSWQGAAQSDATVLVNVLALRDVLNSVTSNLQKPVEAQSAWTKLWKFAPLWQGTSTGVLTAHFNEQLTVKLRLAGLSDMHAQIIAKDTLVAAVTLGQNMLSQFRSAASRQPGNDGAMALKTLDVVDSLLDSVKVEQNESEIVASGAVYADDAAMIVGLALPAIVKAREAARWTQSMNNLKQLALAMHNYHAANGSFPPAVLCGPDGKTPYSWRVALLPYLDQAALYEQYKKDEPWDSPNNKQVLAKMPPVFRDPTDPADSTFSSYFGLTGPSTIFFGKEGAKMSEIPDGTSNTIMLVEAKRDIPWTKPEDIPYAADVAPGGGGTGGSSVGKVSTTATASPPARNVGRSLKDAPLPKLGGHYSHVFLAAMCDGGVRAISQKIDPGQLRKLIIRDDGQPIDWEALEGAPKKPQADVLGK